MPYHRIIAAVASTPWAIDQRKIGPICSFLVLKAQGMNADVAQDQSRAIVRQQKRGTIAVLGIKGIIANRAEQVDDISGPGGTSMEMFSRRLQSVLDDDTVEQIVLDVDSPGGSTQGVTEAANMIRAARDTKPITAVVNALGASAAYWLAAQASEVVVVPSGEVGSVGVYAMHTNMAEQAKMEGIDVEFVSADNSPFKVEFNPFAPLSDEARTFVRGEVNASMDAFVADLAKGRGVTKKKVLADFGQGRVLNAKDSLAAGMVDRIDTFPNVISQLQSGRRRRTERRRAELAMLGT